MSDRRRCILFLSSILISLTMLFESLFGGVAYAWKITSTSKSISGTSVKTSASPTSTTTSSVKKSSAKKKTVVKKKIVKKKKKKARKRTRRRARVVVSRGSMRAADIEAAVRRVGATYWPDKAQLDALVWIHRHESVRPGVISAAGYQGLFQLGNPPKWMVLGDAASETKAGCEYIKRRYKTPLKAKAFWQRHHWY